jgi:hypothetical protein
VRYVVIKWASAAQQKKAAERPSTAHTPPVSPAEDRDRDKKRPVNLQHCIDWTSVAPFLLFLFSLFFLSYALLPPFSFVPSSLLASFTPTFSCLHRRHYRRGLEEGFADRCANAPRYSPIGAHLGLSGRFGVRRRTEMSKKARGAPVSPSAPHAKIGGRGTGMHRDIDWSYLLQSLYSTLPR